MSSVLYEMLIGAESVEITNTAMPGNRTIAIASDGSILTTTSTSPAYVYRSTDLGATWSTVITDTKGFNGVSCNSAGVCLAISGANKVFRSTDNGATWTNPLTMGGVGVASNGSVFIRGNRAIAFSSVASTNTIQYAYSSDSGLTWTTSTATVGGGGVVPVKDCFMFSNGVCLATASSPTSTAVLMRSTDFGVTWTAHPTYLGIISSGIPTVNGNDSTGTTFLRRGTMYAVSSDYGATWSADQTFFAGASTAGFFNKPGTNTWYAPSGGDLYKSTDDGATFSLFATLPGALTFGGLGQEVSTSGVGAYLNSASSVSVLTGL